MAKSKEGGTAAAEKPKEKPAYEPPKVLTKMDDKRAQYARLVIFNFAKKNSKNYGVKADHDVNSIPDSLLLKAGRDLAGMVSGKEGIEEIKQLSEKGSTTGRALTDAYASEVRPFIRKLQVSESFGRRGGLTDEERAQREQERAEKAEARKQEQVAKKEEKDKKAAAEKKKKDDEAKKKAAADKKAAGKK